MEAKWYLSTLSLFILGLLCDSVAGQFKIVDSSNFRTKKGVSNSTTSPSVAFVQINHYGDSTGEQSRAFTIEQPDHNSSLIKVHIQYQKNEIHPRETEDSSVFSPLPGYNASSLSSLLRIIANNKNRDKYNPGFQQRRYKNKPQLRDRQDTRPTENSIHAAYIAQENRRILKKLQYQVIKKVRPAFVSNCTCVKYGEYCPKLQITVARCQPDETMCCF